MLSSSPRHVAGLLVIGAGLHCGARTSLEADGTAGVDGVGGEGDAPITTGTGGEGGGVIEEPPCRLELAGSAVEAIAIAGVSASSPSVVAIDAPSFSTPSHVAVQALTSPEPHPVNQVARWRLAEDWPAAAGLEELPMVFGIESHSWGATVPTPDGSGLAMIWYSDPGLVGRVAFRTLDFASWQGGPSVDLSLNGSSPQALAPGAGVGEFGVGHVGLGYAAAWLQITVAGTGTFARPSVAILDEAGQVQLGPHELGPLTDSPGISPSMVWSGESYLMASSFGACDTLGCPGTLTVHRFRTASGDAFDDSGIDLVWSEDITGIVGRPAIASHDGRTWMSYVQGPDGEDAPQSVIARELAPDGTRLGGPIVVETDTLPTGGLRMTAAPFGLVMMWATDGDDPVLMPQDIGYTQLQLRHLDFDGVAASPPLAMPVTRYSSSGPAALAAVAAPRGIAFTWAGAHDGPDVAYLGLLRCTEP